MEILLFQGNLTIQIGQKISSYCHFAKQSGKEVRPLLIEKSSTANTFTCIKNYYV